MRRRPVPIRTQKGEKMAELFIKYLKNMLERDYAKYELKLKETKDSKEIAIIIAVQDYINKIHYEIEEFQKKTERS
jgi:CYTH domain-containing protein